MTDESGLQKLQSWTFGNTLLRGIPRLVGWICIVQAEHRHLVIIVSGTPHSALGIPSSIAYVGAISRSEPLLFRCRVYTWSIIHGARFRQPWQITQISVFRLHPQIAISAS